MSEPESPNPTDSPSPEETPTEASPVEPPTEVAVQSEPEAPTEAVPVGSSPTRHFWDTGRVLAVAIVVVLLGGAVGFLIGRSTADSGPATLADAVGETAKGDLPAGDLSLDQILGAAGNRLGKDGGGLLGGLLGGGQKGGDTSGVLGQILDQLGNQLGNGGTTTPATPGATQPFLGVVLEAPASGQSGGRVAQVAAGSPAADAGVRVGDVVTAVDGTATPDAAAVATAVRDHRPGDQITLTVTRDGASTDVKTRLGNADSTTDPATPTTPPTTRTA